MHVDRLRRPEPLGVPHLAQDPLRETTAPGSEASSASRSNSFVVNASDSPARLARRPRTSISSSPDVDLRAVAARMDAPHHRADAGQQLAEAERLDDVVVRAELEPDHPIDLLPLGGDDDDRHVRAGAQPSADLVPSIPGRRRSSRTRSGSAASSASSPVATRVTSKPSRRSPSERAASRSRRRPRRSGSARPDRRTPARSRAAPPEKKRYPRLAMPYLRLARRLPATSYGRAQLIRPKEVRSVPQAPVRDRRPARRRRRRRPARPDAHRCRRRRGDAGLEHARSRPEPRSLDRLEASLERSLAEQPPAARDAGTGRAQSAASRTVFVRSHRRPPCGRRERTRTSTARSTTRAHEDEHEDADD